MHKSLLCLLLVLIVFLGSVSACPNDVKCPIDDSGSYFTGETQTVDGHLMGKYRCSMHQHVFWVRCS
jgi:hypothetical protein